MLNRKIEKFVGSWGRGENKKKNSVFFVYQVDATHNIVEGSFT